LLYYTLGEGSIVLASRLLRKYKGQHEMVNEQYDDKYESQEEGEYHFSDDQVSYEIDPDSKETATTTSSESLGAKLNRSRRLVIGIVVFIVLVGIVYKMLAPTSSQPLDFDKQVGAAKVTTTTTTQAQNPSVTMPSTQEMPSTVSSAPPAQQPSVVPAVPTGEAQQKSVMDRLAYVEQQNSAMLDLLQTQYAQKMTDYETQNTQLRTQVQELNTRIAGMEVAFHQMTKILRGMSGPAAMSGEVGIVPSKPLVPKMAYTVQAIIPGRAWLKSDAGDTVTVAEGDVLKDYGRITKIDPYDGVVNIDTGNKVITLSYGVGGE
jgi:intracellular multiplication protein IcmG